MWPDSQETAYLVIFTDKILNGKLHFLCIVVFFVFCVFLKFRCCFNKCLKCIFVVWFPSNLTLTSDLMNTKSLSIILQCSKLKFVKKFSSLQGYISFKDLSKLLLPANLVKPVTTTGLLIINKLLFRKSAWMHK